MEQRFSADYFQRKEMMSTCRVPTLSEAKLRAGLPLSIILFEECHSELSETFGLTPYLRGPRGDLWTSPSDLLLGKVALKPPLTQKHIQALTHEGILDLGAHVEQKFLNEMQLAREKAVGDREDYLTRMYEAKKIELVKQVKTEEEQKYSQRINELQEFYENQICQLLWECYDQVQRLQEQMQVETDSLNVLWQAKLEGEVGETVKRITEEFLRKMGRQERILANVIKKQAGAARSSKNTALELERTKCKETMIQMKHKLQCENISNLMYLLCKERRKCSGEKKETEENFRAQIRKHKENMNKKSSTIAKLNKIRTKKTRQLKVRERCLTEILRQFQKFIYFALKAAPTQGEFLLNINKLIQFELQDFCVPEEQPKPEIVGESRVEAGEDADTGIKQLLAAQSFSEEGERGHSDALPAFYFNNKMYVREDFRDMMAAGIEIGEKNSLWNEDVEELMKIFRGTVEDRRSLQVEKIKSHHSSVHFGLDQSPRGSRDSRNLSETVAIVLSPRPGSILTTPEKGSAETQQEQREASPKMRTQSHDFDVRSETIKPLPRPSRLTLARDSVVLTLSSAERRSLQAMCKTLEETASRGSAEKDKVLKTVDEEESSSDSQMVPTDDAKSAKSLETQSRGTSKLLLATDSYEIIKSNLAIASAEEKTPSEQNGKRKSQLTFNSKVSSVEDKPSGGAASERPRRAQTQRKRPKGTLASSSKAPPSRRNVPKAKVVGSRETKEHKQEIEEFTNERIASMVNMMKENPSLIRLFTPCLK